MLLEWAIFKKRLYKLFLPLSFGKRRGTALHIAVTSNLAAAVPPGDLWDCCLHRRTAHTRSPIEAPTDLVTSERFVDEFDTVTGA